MEYIGDDGRLASAYDSRDNDVEAVMSRDLKLTIPDDLSEALEAAAKAEGKTPEETAEAALRMGLEDRSWQELLGYGSERGKASGYTEDQVSEVVERFRKEHPRIR